MELKERLIYIVAILLMGGYIIYNLFISDPGYTDIYKKQIIELENEILNLKKSKDSIDIKVLTFKDSISKINLELEDVKAELIKSKNKTNEEVSAVNNYDNDDIYKFISNRYPSYSPPTKNSKGDN